jgi:hypothetical protein
MSVLWLADPHGLGWVQAVDDVVGTRWGPWVSAVAWVSTTLLEVLGAALLAGLAIARRAQVHPRSVTGWALALGASAAVLGVVAVSAIVAGLKG